MATIAFLLALQLCFASVLCREIVFPPRAAVRANGSPQQLRLQGDDGEIMADDHEFAGLSTFANLPYVHCTSASENIESYDIAFLGAPFDTGVTARPGARYGPRGIRQGSTRIGPEFDWNIYTGQNDFQDWAKIVDCGDAPLTFLDNTLALKQLIISGRAASNQSVAKTPRIITLGGDHTTTLAALRSTYDHFGPVSVIHFDSHIDTWDPAVLGGGLSEYAGVNHGTFLHIAHEEGLILNSSIHAGIRAPVANRKYDLKNDAKCGFSIITARAIDKLTPWGVIDKLKSRVGDTKVYISVDIDVLDPSFAPATGTAEVGGWTTRELLTILDGLSGLNVIGADVVEVAPIYDNPGETTVLAAAQVAISL
ncbi:putative arginase family protein [Phaeomoniella chlamydospora]|uniref:Putative arginase family protein n=1 Tax=Phaeomoniella chlamydospora TaxID=158046 RepID=A0A0G2GV24_PHACM|nr:putative arginase family protein [Phaeomoniella chlamydospora]